MSMGISPLYQYVASHAGQILVLDETIGDICWKDDPTVDPRYFRNYEPYLYLNPKSVPTTPPPEGPRTRYGLWEPENNWPRTGMDVFRIRSSLACEGLVGLVHLWKWVRRMIVQHHWQKEVAVGIAPEYPGGSERWYRIGISVRAISTTLRVNDKKWFVSTDALLSADLESAPRLESNIRKYLPFNQSSTMGGTPTPQTAGQSSTITTISDIPTTLMTGTSYATDTSKRRPAPKIEMAEPASLLPGTSSRRSRPHKRARMTTAPVPPLSPSPHGEQLRTSGRRRAKQPYPPAHQETALPLCDLTPVKFDLRPISMSDPRYIESQRSPASYYAGSPRTEKSTKQATFASQSRTHGHKRNATEMATSLGSPLLVESPVEALRSLGQRPLLATSADSLPSTSLRRHSVHPTTGPCYPSPTRWDEASAIRTVPQRDTSPISAGPSATENSQVVSSNPRYAEAQYGPLPRVFSFILPRSSLPHRQRLGQPLSSSRKSQLRAIGALPFKRRLEAEESKAVRAREVKIREAQKKKAQTREQQRREAETREAQESTGIKREVKWRRIPQACGECRTRKKRCTGIVDEGKCGLCIKDNLECHFAPISAPVPTSEASDKRQSPPPSSSAPASIPSMDVTTNTSAETESSSRAFEPIIEEALSPYKEHVYDRRLFQPLKVKDDMRPWTQDDLRHTQRPWGDVGKGGDQFGRG